MHEGLVSILVLLGGLLVVGALLALADRRNFAPQWLLAAGVLVFVNDAALTRLYGVLPDFLGGGWNWQGKALALAITLAVASRPAVGWQRSGLTLRQKPGSLVSCVPVALLYSLLFVALALGFPNEPVSTETVAFQLTMPGFEEEPFYRGILLLTLNEAFRGRIRALGVDWGWGAVLSCALFGLAHAFGYSARNGFHFDATTMALTAVPSLLAVWLRERSGSLLLPVILHNFGNSVLLAL
jgi:membrane protease YdiL (CAAX protease family)